MNPLFLRRVAKSMSDGNVEISVDGLIQTAKNLQDLGDCFGTAAANFDANLARVGKDPWGDDPTGQQFGDKAKQAEASTRKTLRDARDGCHNLAAQFMSTARSYQQTENNNSR